MIAVGLVLLLLVLLIVVLCLLKDLGKSMQSETEEPMMNREEQFVEDFN
jgi:Na+-transporting methylmalonyl-CoA/oxaloacetate decarboxylase gamma subunit